MSAQSPDNAISSGKLTRVLIYVALLVFAFYYLLPLYVMVVNSLKTLDEIRQGGMLSPPHEWTIEPWLSAWSTAQIGVQPTGLRPIFHQFDPHGGPGRCHIDRCWRPQWLCPDQMAVPRLQRHVRHAVARLLHPIPDRAHSYGAHAWVCSAWQARSRA